MAPSGAKKLHWELEYIHLDSADERGQDIIVEEGNLISYSVRQRQIFEAHEFLSKNGIEIRRPDIDLTMVRDIDKFDIATIRPD